MQGALIWEVCDVLGQPFDRALMFIETAAPYLRSHGTAG
jgi:hypothetical protein